MQGTLVNYRKGTNRHGLVNVIPLHGGVHDTTEEVDEDTYHEYRISGGLDGPAVPDTR